VKLHRIAIPLLLATGIGYCAFRPVCVPLANEDLAKFAVPIEEREDHDFYLRIFQLREGRWHQCKTWLSRQLFF